MDRAARQVYAEVMAPSADESGYLSPYPFDANRIRAAAVYCSDGRYGEHFDDLLQNALQLPRYDRLAVPGGAACLAGHFHAYREEEGVAEQLRFLVQIHDVRRIVLIAHQDCAYYSTWLKVPPLQVESKQREDLVKAIRHVRRLGGDIDVQAFFARRDGNRILFEPCGT
jgi:hypothetical protein